MAVYSGSRYEGSQTYYDEPNEIVYLEIIRTAKFEPSSDDHIIVVTEGMRLDVLAKEMYGDAQLEWILMEANPQYFTPFDIKPGDRLNVPTKERVLGNA